MSDNHKQKVIVTGAAGFIGYHLADDVLVERDYDIHVIDNLSDGKKENVNSQAAFHQTDIRDSLKIKPIMTGREYIFHLAVLPQVQCSIKNPVKTNEVNMGGTLNILLAAKKSGVKKVIYSASSLA